MKELKAIARKIGVKNYENLSRIELVKEIDKLEQPKESKKKILTSSLLLKGKKSIGVKPKKKKKQKNSIEFKHKKIKRIQETVDKLILKLKQLQKMMYLMIVILNIKVMVIEINQYQFLDILIILENI